MDKKLLEGDFSWDMLGDIGDGRRNLGDQMPVVVYRLFQYTMRAVLVKHFGKDEMIKLFRECGQMAGVEFANNVLDIDLSLEKFVSQLQSALRDLQIGILRFEEFDANTGEAEMTVGEDLDCSGLPVSGECVCNFDEGFISGILSSYLGKPYEVEEIDCWATGGRVCRFKANPKTD